MVKQYTVTLTRDQWDTLLYAAFEYAEILEDADTGKSNFHARAIQAVSCQIKAQLHMATKDTNVPVGE